MSSSQQDQFAAVTADIDPRRFRSLYKQRAGEFIDQQRDLAAQRAPGIRRQMEKERLAAQNSRNFAGADTGAVDFDAQDQIRDARRRLSLARSV